MVCLYYIIRYCCFCFVILLVIIKYWFAALISVGSPTVLPLLIPLLIPLFFPMLFVLFFPLILPLIFPLLFPLFFPQFNRLSYFSFVAHYILFNVDPAPSLPLLTAMKPLHRCYRTPHLLTPSIMRYRLSYASELRRRIEGRGLEAVILT